MIPIKNSAIDTFVAMANRDQNTEYYRGLAVKTHAENRPLYIAIFNNAVKIARESNLTNNEEEEQYLIANIVCSCLAVYHVIDMQLEANELSNIYGE